MKNVDHFQSISNSTCFSASTPILTPNGEVMIEDIAVGDSVLAFDGFNELVPSKVVNLQHKTTITNKKTLQNLANTNEAITHNGTEKTINGTSYTFLEKSSKVVIDGVNYTAGAISEAYDLAEQSVVEFITNNNQQIRMLEGGISYALNQTFVELGTLAANGQAIDTTKILQKFAVNAGIKALPLWGQGWVGDEAMTIPSNDNRPKYTLQIAA